MPLVADAVADIVIPIVTAILGLAAGFLPTWYGARQQRRTERLALQRELANDFVAKLGGAANAARFALEARERGSSDAGKALDDARWFVGEVAALLPSVRVRVAADAGAAAKQGVEGLRRTLELIDVDDLTSARSAYQQAVDADDALIAALAALDAG